MKTIYIQKENGNLELSGQLKTGYHCGIFVLPAGTYQLKIEVTQGKARINHTAFNEDGGYYSLPPKNGQKQYFSVSKSECLDEIILIGQIHKRPDQIEIVNTSMFDPLAFRFEVKPLRMGMESPMVNPNRQTG